MRNAKHEEALINTFFLPGRQKRALTQLASHRKRSQFLNRLSHLDRDYIDERYISVIPAARQDASSLYALLKLYGAFKTGYCISQWKELDYKELPVQDALRKVVGAGWGTLISLMPGKLVFYESEKGTRFILKQQDYSGSGMESFTVPYVEPAPALDDGWEGPVWCNIDAVVLAHFRPEGSDHFPHTRAKLLFSNNGLYGMFLVEDRYVVCRHTGYMDPVHTDSCVEFFIKPKKETGYFNFEFNCGGALRASFIVDPTRVGDRFKEFIPLPEEDGAMIKVYHTLPGIVTPEITEPISWFLAFYIPFALLERYVGHLGTLSGQRWTGNFYKCGDATSHPHWASWSPLPERNFHLPECFGELTFLGGATECGV